MDVGVMVVTLVGMGSIKNLNVSKVYSYCKVLRTIEWRGRKTRSLLHSLYDELSSWRLIMRWLAICSFEMKMLLHLDILSNEYTWKVWLVPLGRVGANYFRATDGFPKISEESSTLLFYDNLQLSEWQYANSECWIHKSLN